MPNGLTDVTPDKNAIKSGDSVKLTILYHSNIVHDFTVTASGKFTVSPTSQPLAPDENGRAYMTVTITRGDPNDPPDCILTCTFFNSLPVVIGVS